MGANVEQSKPDEPKEFVVTTFGSGTNGRKPLVLDSGVWNGKNPYGLGYPIRWVLERTGEGARIRRVDGRTEEVMEKPLRRLKQAELSGEVPIELEAKRNLWIRLQPVFEMGELARSSWVPEAVEVGVPDTSETDRIFIRAVIAVSIAFLLMVVGVRFLPSGAPAGDGLIPEEFAKVLLSPAVKSAAPKARSSAGSTAVGNVVQAFQSKAVQKTAQSLLNPAAAKALLSRTSLLDAGSAKAAVKGMLDGKSVLSQTAGSGGIDFKDVKGSLSGGTGKQSDYSGKAASAPVGGGGLAAVSFDAVGVSEGLTKEEVGKVIHEHLGQIRYCYEAALARSPGLEGKLLMSFTVGADGTVKDSQTKESSGNAGLDSCIKSRLMGWKFPKPRQGVDIGVTYPFIFKSLSD